MDSLREKKIAWLSKWLNQTMRSKTDPWHDGGLLPDPVFTANWILNQLEEIELDEEIRFDELNVINQREHQEHEFNE